MTNGIDLKAGEVSELNNPQEDPASFLSREYARWKALLNAQPTLTQYFLEAQARLLADGLVQSLSQVSFSLPDQIVPEGAAGPAGRRTLSVPSEMREQLVGGLMDRLTRTNLTVALRERLDELESSTNSAVGIGAGLMRFATAIHLVHTTLPSGRTVRYRSLEGEEIPSIPVEDRLEPGSAMTAKTDAIIEETFDSAEEGRGEVQVPYVPAARRFYLPQWVAFDDDDHLLVGSLNEAEAHLASMQRFLRVLHTAVSLAAFIVIDEQYQRKRYGMLGQLVNQGRALARYRTQQIINTIQRRAATNDLHRGLSLSLPYFDDQALEMRIYDFRVIPAVMAARNATRHIKSGQMVTVDGKAGTVVLL